MPFEREQSGVISPYCIIKDNNIYDAVYKWRYFRCDALTLYGHISTWTIHGVTDMSGLFKNYEDFNEDLSGWNVSSVTNMSEMFKGSTSFNQSLYNWPIQFTNISFFNPYSSSICVTSMLNNTSSLQFQILTGSVNQDSIYYAFSILDMDLYSKIFRPIIEWDTILVNDISGLFKDTIFNQDISGWNVSNVTNMDSLFENNKVFNQSLNNWNTSNVTSMNSVFQGAINFNQSLENWDTSNVTSINSMFLGAIRFNSRVNNWNVSNIIDSSGAFMNAFSFSQDIYNWKMSRCINFTNMFNGCISLQASNLTLDISTNFEINNDFYMQLLID